MFSHIKSTTDAGLLSCLSHMQWDRLSPSMRLCTLYAFRSETRIHHSCALHTLFDPGSELAIRKLDEAIPPTSSMLSALLRLTRRAKKRQDHFPRLPAEENRNPDLYQIYEDWTTERPHEYLARQDNVGIYQNYEDRRHANHAKSWPKSIKNKVIDRLKSL